MSLAAAGVRLIDCVHKTPEAVEDGYPYVAIPDMKGGRIDFSNARRIRKADFDEWRRKARPRRHDVILSRRTNPGVIAIDDTETEFALGQNLVLLRADGSRVFPPFLRWLASGPEWWGQIEKFINVGAVFSSLRCGDVPKFELSIPPLAEQKAIAGVLGALDDKIELSRRMNATLEAMARALFRSWFVDFDPVHARTEGRAPVHMDPTTAALFPARFGEDGLPEGWREGRLGDVANAPRVGIDPASISSDTPYIGLEHMPRRSIAIADWGLAEGVASQKSIMKAGDFLFGKLRPYFHKVGVSPVDGVCSTEIVVVRPRALLWAGFVLAVISSDDFVEHTNASSAGTRMPRTNWRDMSAFSITIPPDHVARCFEHLVRPFREKIVANIHEARTLAALRDTLLPKLMSGELRVREAEARVAEVA
jgi:type I restriction enzyme S subunit